MFCPRCGMPVEPSRDGMSTCETDGEVVGVGAIESATVHGLLHQAVAVDTPTWLPWPVPSGWSVTGHAYAGDSATVVAVAGPDLWGGLAEIHLVCEEPGTGLGERVAGVPGTVVGDLVVGRRADRRVQVGEHMTPLWQVGGPTDREVLVGEAAGRWLWVVCFPGTTALLLADQLRLVALHDLAAELDEVPMSALTARLAAI